MELLALADLAGMSEPDVKAHIADGYAGEKSGFDYGDPSADDKARVATDLERFQLLIAYEHVGDYGCDSSSWFLMRETTTGRLFEFSGSHCSCYGFEGQYEPEVTSFDYLNSDKLGWYGGGYDDNKEVHRQRIKAHIAQLAEAVP